MKRLSTMIFITFLVLTGCTGKNSSNTLTTNNPSYKIILASNPTTGYSWSAYYDKTLLTTRHKYVRPHTQMLGAGGKDVWTFTATKKALQTNKEINTTIKMSYARPWEHNKKPAQTKIIPIIIA